MTLTLEQLVAIMPLARRRAGVFIEPLSLATAESGIDTPLRIAAFLSQVAVESGSLLYMRELASGDAYEGRIGLGNTQPGDGRKYKGRGPIQITGRNNYRACSLDLFGDERLLEHPEILEEPLHGCRASAWFWRVNNINRFADAGDIDGVSDAVNRGRKTAAYGDALGFKDRLAFYERAKEVLHDADS